MNKNIKSRVAFEVLVILGALLLLCYITRLWPLLFLVIPGILIAAIRLLFYSVHKNEDVTPPPAAASPDPPRQDTEQDVTRMAFGILQRRVTDQVTASYPDARWVWEAPNAMERFADGLPLNILLNRAGGFQKAAVQIHNLRFNGLLYETVEDLDETGSDSDEENDSDPDVDTDHTDYSALAFEWVDANMLALNTRCNESLAHGETTLLIPAHDLPQANSWPDICAELKRGGFASADTGEDGILVTLPK